MRATTIMAVVGLILAVFAAAAQACEIQDVAPAGGGSGPNGSYRPGDQLKWTLYARGEGASAYTVKFAGESKSGTIDPEVLDTATGSFTVPDLGSQPRTLTLSGEIGDNPSSKTIEYTPAPTAAPQAQTAPAGGGTTAGSDAAPATAPAPAASPQPKASARVTPRTRPSARGPAPTSRPSAHRAHATTPRSSGHTTMRIVPALQRTNAAPRATVPAPDDRATGPAVTARSGRASATDPTRARTRASRPTPARTSSPPASAAIRPAPAAPAGDTTAKPDRRPLALIGALLLIGLLGLGLRGRRKLAARELTPEDPAPQVTGALVEDPVEEELQTMIATTVADEPSEAPRLPV